MNYCIPFADIRLSDTFLVGGKNAALGELIFALAPKGIKIPDGFAVTAEAYREFLSFNRLQVPLQQTLDGLDTVQLTNLNTIARQCRDMIMNGRWPEWVESDILKHYRAFMQQGKRPVAVRSSATAEDLPTASFAGQHDSFLYVPDEDTVLEKIVCCYASLFNDRAIKYRMDHGFAHLQVALSAGIQEMVQSDNGSAGVAFTLEPESGSSNIIYITSSWGLGESIVQGQVNPDEFYLFKPAIAASRIPLIRRQMGTKKIKTVLSVSPHTLTTTVATSSAEQQQFSLSDEQVLQFGKWALLMEEHFGYALDIEWAWDESRRQLFIVQARPETIFSAAPVNVLKTYALKEKQEPVCRGKAVGQAILSGRVCLINSLADAPLLQPGDIIVTDVTNPDWNALLKKAIGIVTNKGGRTSHAAIVARERGIPAVVGTENATAVLQHGQIITVSCAEGDEGRVYTGKLQWEESLYTLREPQSTNTQAMLILSDPEKAFVHARLPAKGVGLLRVEFIISESIGIHPMALAHFNSLPDGEVKQKIEQLTAEWPDKKDFFVSRLAESVALFGAAFYPREVIVRMSDFKSNEYASLLGGAFFEQKEENPMLGFRGASRYDHPLYRDGFQLECAALRKVRDDMGLTNIKLMIPFCRTPKEGRKVIRLMKQYGLEQKKNGLEIWVMAEIPSNVMQAKEFAALFDGFSIGSNDMTQLVLGVDRDAERLSGLFDENNPSVRRMLKQMIQSAHAFAKPVGLCGQGPSDSADFARWLVSLHIDSISFSPDAFLRGLDHIAKAENKKPKKIIV